MLVDWIPIRTFLAGACASAFASPIAIHRMRNDKKRSSIIVPPPKRRHSYTNHDSPASFGTKCARLKLFSKLFGAPIGSSIVGATPCGRPRFVLDIRVALEDQG